MKISSSTQRWCKAWTLAGAACTAAALLAGCSPSTDNNKSAVSNAQAAQAQQQRGPVAVARGKIEVEGGLLELAPAIDGTVQQLPVKEGQSVQRGQLLLRVADDGLRADLAVAESEWKLAQAKYKSLAGKIPPLKATLTRWQTAAREGAADQQNVDEAAIALRNAQSDADISLAEGKVAEAKVSQLRAQQRRYELHAPEAATVVRLRAHVGSQVTSTQTSMTLLPNRPLVVRAELNESFASAVREGMRASIVVDGDSGGTSSLPEAKVLRISPVFGPAHLQDDTQRGPIRVIECVLAFDNAPANARVGQNVRVTFHE